ncbi:MAG: autotransporter-associated beta strand repeat-containing protein, partial [Opitutia bacterium]
AGSGLLGATDIDLVVRQGATFDLNGVSVGTVASGTNAVDIFNGAGTVTNTGAAATLRVGNGNGAGYFTGNLTGANLHLVKSGTAALSLTSSASDFGTLTIIGGTVAFALPAGTTTMNAGAASPLGTGATAANLVFNAGTLQYTGSNATIFSETQSPSFSTDRQFTLAGNATIQSSGQYGNNVLAGGAQNNASVIFASTADLTFSGSGLRTLTLGGNSIGDNEFRLRLRNNPSAATDYLSLTKADAGLWILNPATSNTYGGTTTISAGALRVASSAEAVQGLSASSPLVINGGVLETTGTFSRTLAAPVAGTGGTVQIPGGNSGFAASTPDRLVVTLGGGGLTWGSTNFAPAQLVLGSSTALGETEITNNIALGTSARTITVNNNANTGTMITAGILSGVISGSAGGTLTKAGGGVLILGDANTYVADTIITNGNLIVTSLGNASGTAASSLGASGGRVVYSVDADLNGIFYVGPGETSTRPFLLGNALGSTTARTYRIDASGSGPLVLNGSFSNTKASTGALTFELRGVNTDGNQMNMVLANSATATLNVGKADGGTWILNPASANQFTGAITVSGGNLGLTAFGIGSATGLTVNNGGIFAFGSALTTALTLKGTNSTAVIAGQNSITLGGVAKTGGNNQWTISNNLENGALLTVNGNFVNEEAGTTAATQTISIRGFGSTLWNGAITENAAAGGKIAWNIAIDPTASFTTSGAANTYTGGTTLTDGILILDKTSGPLGATSGTFNFNGGTLRVGSSIANLSGANAITNPVTIGGSPPKVDGSKSIEFSGAVTMGVSRSLQNELSGGASLIFSGTITNSAASALTLLGAGNTSITGTVTTGTGAQGLTMQGNGVLSLTGANNATGTLTASRGTTILSGAAGAWGAGRIATTAGGVLRLSNSVTNNNDRLFNTGTVTMTGGTLDVVGNTTAEVTGALTLNSIDGVITISGSGSSLTFASVTFANTGSSLDLSGVGSNSVIFTTAPTLTGGLHPRFFLGGEDFATLSNATAVTAFNSYAAQTNINVGAATDTLKVGAAYANDDLAFSRTINAITLTDTTARTLGVQSGVGDATLTITSGGIIAAGSVTHTLAVPRLNLGSNAFIQVLDGSTLDITGGITSASSLMKALPGTLKLSAKQWYNITTNVTGGTLTLNAGANTIFPGSSALLNVDGGGTIDLNGSVQYVPGSISSPGALPGTGGAITSAGGLLVLGAANTTWGGTISGAGLSFAKTGGNANLTLQQAQTYTGSTTLMGAVTLLENDATLLNTSGIDINYATLTLSNNTGLQTQNNNRIGDSIPIALRGGTISYTGRLTTAATETFGAVTLAQGANTITANTGGGTVTSVDLTFASLTRQNNATINFTGTNLGQPGNNSRIVFTAPIPTSAGGMIGAWAIANQTDYAAYNTGLGVGIVGQGGFVGYDGSSGSGSLWQIPASVNTTTTLPAGTTNAAILRLAGAFTNDIAFTNSGDVLNLELGGLLRSDNNNASTIGTTAIRGVLTSGSGELITYNHQNTLTIHSVIQGAGTKYIKDGASTTTLTAANTYGGGTVVNRGTLNISPTVTDGSVVVIPAGGLTIQGGLQGAGTTVNLSTSNAIAASTDLTMNGRANLTFAASVNQTLNSVTFNNNGGDANPTLTVTGTLTLSSSTPVTATSSNAFYVSTITGGTLALASGANTFSVAPVAIGATTYTDLHSTLNVASLISGAGASITKTGNGLLQLSSGSSTFTGGVTVNAGGLVIGAAGSGIGAGTGAAAITGPVGAGTLTMASGTRLLIDNSSRTFYNPVVFGGTPTFSNNNVGTNVTLTVGGLITPSSNALEVNIDNPFLTVALAGRLANASSITSISKTGLGNLSLNYTGISGSVATSLSGGGTLGILHDGDGDMHPDDAAIGIGAVTGLSRPASILVGRAGTTALWNQAINKVITPASLTDQLSAGLTVTNNNQYQLRIADDFALESSVSGVAPVFSVSTASNSNTLSGLLLSGTISGGAPGTSATVFTKSGAGTLELTGANTFGGGGSRIDVTAGILAVPSDAALGDSANVVRLSANSGTQGFRATSSFSTARTFNLNAATVGIDVNPGATLTLTSPFTFSAATNALQKNDLGTLVIDANNSAREGVTNIAGGILLVDNVNDLGTGQVVINSGAGGGAALHLSGGVNFANAINMANATSTTPSGIDNTGAVFSASGSNTISGAITNTTSVGIFFGAANGATLNIGGLGLSNSPTFNAVGTGVININGSIGTSGVTITKIGTGTLNWTTAQTTTLAFAVNQGTFNISGSGAFSASTGNITVQNNALLNVDDTGTATTRIGGTARTMNLVNGNFTFTANGAAPSALQFGALTSTWGGNTITLNNGGAANATLTFASMASNVVNGGSVLRFESSQTFNSTTNRLVFGTTSPTLTNGIIQRAVVTDASGVNFATHGGNNTPIVAYSAYLVSDGSGVTGDATFTNVNGGTAYGLNASNASGVFATTPTFRVTGDTAVSSNPGLNFRGINALKIEGAGTDVAFAASGGVQLAVGAGNILSTAANQTLGNAALVATGSAPVVFLGTINPQNSPVAATAPAFASVEGGILVASGASLTVNAALFNSSNVTKGLSGDLTFATRQFFNAATGTSANYFTINGGTVTLIGGENTLWQGAQGGTAGQNMAIGPGATLDLNGNSQMVGDLRSPNGTAFAASGGAVVNGGANATLISVGSASGWGGNISSGTGTIFYNKAGANTQTFYSDNTYTGGTLINGGTLTLQDEGRLSGTSSVELAYGGLTFNNGGTANATDRLANAAAITSRGGALILTGRDLTNVTETVGTLALERGQTNLSVQPTANGAVRSVVLSVGNLTQSNNSTLLFYGNSTGTANGQMGSNGRIIIANGTSLLVNNIIPWAYDGTNFASYVAPSSGNVAGGLATLNQSGYAGYDATTLAADGGAATRNLSLSSACLVVPDENAGATGAYLATAIVCFSTANNQTFTFADSANDTLNLTSGGFIIAGNQTGKSVGAGKITSGGNQSSGTAPLYLMVNQGTAITFNASITDNGAGAATRLVYSGANAVSTVLSAANTYTGGTVVNGGVTYTATLGLNVSGANAGSTVAIPAGDLIINGATVRLDAASQIHASVVPEIRGAGVLNLNNFNQTLAGLNFVNDGSSTQANVGTGTGVLTLTGGVTASSTNVGQVSLISGTGATVAGAGGVIALDLGGATRTFNVSPVTVNGNTTVANATPTLAVSAPVGSSTDNATVGITKTGNGLLQLSGASLFGGGVSVNAGGLAVGGSTNVTTRDGATGVVTAFTSGPVGTGALTIGAAGTYLTSTAANTLSNALVLAGNEITLRGTNNLTIQGNNTTTTLFGNTTVNVEAPQAILTLNMVLDDAGGAYGLTKEGLGTLLLGNNNTFTGGVTVNAGTLALAGLNAGSTSPVFAGTNVTIGDGGMLSLLNNGTGSLGLVSYATGITINGANAAANLHVGNNGANTSNTVEVPSLTLLGGQILNVSGQNGYSLRLLNVTGDAVGGSVPQINVASGTSVYVFDYEGDKPINVGQGSLIFPDLVTIGTTTTLPTGTIALSGNYPLSVQSALLTSANMTAFGYASGGLRGDFVSLATSPTSQVTSQGAGLAPSSGAFLTSRLGDGNFSNRPFSVAGTAIQGFATFSGFLEVATAGTYTFRSGADDGFALYIDGNAVYTDPAPGHGVLDIAPVSVTLDAGYHSIVYKIYNGTGGGGYRMLYSGPDTDNAFRIPSPSRLFSTTALPSAANGFNGAAIINNSYSLAASTTATIDTFATQFGAVIDPAQTLTIGANAVLNLINGSTGSFGTGWFGAAGATTIGNGAILATTNTGSAGAGTLALLGPITHSGTGLNSGTTATNALVKTGQGTLLIGADNATAGTFTGDLAIQGGTVMLGHVGALPEGTVTVGATANSAQAAATTTLSSNVVTGITSTASMQKGMAVSGTGIPAGSYIVSVDSGTQVTLSQNATASGTVADFTANSGGRLDVNGFSISKGLTLNGVGSSLYSANFTGALWNSSPTAVTLSGNMALGSAASVGGYGDMTLSGNVTGSYGLTKTGDNTLVLSGSGNSFTTLAVNLGILKLGHAAALSDTAGATTVLSGAILDLNGFAVGAEPLIIAGAGFSGSGTLSGRGTVSAQAALLNSSSTAASFGGTVSLTNNVSIGGSRVNDLSGVTSGDITLGGVISNSDTNARTLTKTGTNVLTLTAANTYGPTTINLGAITVSGSGTLGNSGTVTLNGATMNGLVPDVRLTLNNATTASSTRLNARNVTFAGGHLELIGHASTAVNETLANDVSLLFNVGHNLISLDNRNANVRITTTSSGTNAASFAQQSQATVFIRGDALGQGTAAANSNIMLANITAPTNYQVMVGGSGTGGTTMRIMPWAVADVLVTSTGTASTAQFATWDSTNGVRPLNFSSEMSAPAASATVTADTNTRVAAANVTLGTGVAGVTATVLNSLTFESGGSMVLNAFRDLRLNSGGILAKASTTIAVGGTGLGVGSINARDGGTNNRRYYVHVMGAPTILTSNATFGGAYAPTTGGLAKTGDGTLLLNSSASSNYTGTTSINLGTLEIAAAAPDNALFYRFATSALNASTTADND